MKYIISFCLFLFLSAGVFAQGVMEIKKNEIVLKDLKVDDLPTTATFQIKNTGNQPIIITRVVPLNSQFKPDWDKQPIAPGKTGEIRISFTSSNLQDKFEVKTMIYSNASNNRAEVKLSGNLTDNPAKPELLYKVDMDGLKFKNTNLNLNKVYISQVASDTAFFLNTRKDTLNLGVQYQPNYLNVRFIPARVAPGQKGMAIVTLDAPKKNDYGYCYETIVLSFNNDRNYNHRLSISANLVEDFSKLNKKQLAEAPIAIFDKTEISFGDIKPGSKANCDFTLTNTGKSVLFVRKTKASCGCTAIALGENSLAPGKSTVIRATFDSTGKSGRQYKSVTVITNDPKNPEITLTLNGNIQ